MQVIIKRCSTDSELLNSASFFFRPFLPICSCVLLYFTLCTTWSGVCVSVSSSKIIKLFLPYVFFTYYRPTIYPMCVCFSLLLIVECSLQGTVCGWPWLNYFFNNNNLWYQLKLIKHYTQVGPLRWPHPVWLQDRARRLQIQILG